MVGEPRRQGVAGEPSTGPVTFLLTDVEGSTRRWQADPAAMQKAIERHDALVSRVVAECGGVTIKSRGEGDSTFSVFDRPTAALEAAAALQRGLEKQLRVRMAIHTGEAQFHNDDYFGTTVNRCARLRSIAFGGQVLVSAATAELVRDHLPTGLTLLDLGTHALKDLERPEHVFQVMALGLDAEFPALKSLDQSHNLPVQLTSFVGRHAELSTVKRLISESRLVTLTGAGGVGKTRLAIEVARQTVDEYRDGAWLVELAPLANPALVPNVVLAALGYGAQSDTPTESLVSLLEGRELICVLDNCEHLLEACAGLANAMLASCPQLRILATSRELLGLSGETIWRVPSLATPDSEGSLSLEELQGLEAVQLFVQRAGAARPGFQLTKESAGAAARICRRLDGIPLAIELAAARIRTLPIGAIDERIGDRFHLLTGGSRVSVPRQRTLQAMLDWSHDLLDGDEQRLFRRLAVFRGGFTLEAAESICTDDRHDGAAESVLDGLTSLVDKSLVILEERPNHTARYSLLETIRAYGHERLQSADEQKQTARRHALYYLALGETMYHHLRGPEQGVWFTRVEDELDNLRACLDWALEHDPRSALQLTLAVQRYWIYYRRGEGHDWLKRSLAAAPEPSVLRARGLYYASFFASYQGSFDEARQLGNECLMLSRELRSALWQGQALSAVAIGVGNLRQEGWLAQSLALFQQAEDLVRESADLDALARVLNNYGWVLSQAGEREAARPKLQEAVALAQQLNDPWLSAPILGSLAALEFASDNRDAAEAGWRHELELAGQIGAFYAASEALAGLARLSLADSQMARCLQLTSAAVEFFRRTASVMDAPDSDLVRDSQEKGRHLIGTDLAESAWREGARMSLTQAVQFGLGERLQADLVPPAGAPAI